VRHHLGHPLVSHSDGLMRRLRRVGERAEEVEHRRDAELPARGGGVPKRRVEPRGEAEGDAATLHTLRHERRVEISDDPERLEQVRGSARRRRGAVAVLDDTRSGGRDDDRCHGRDVDGVGAVAARAAGVHGRTRHVDPPGVGEHRADEAVDLRGRLTLRPEPDDEAGQLRGSCLAEKDLLHRPGRVVRRQLLAAQQRGQQARPRRLR
jgi:hypothetical protein